METLTVTPEENDLPEDLKAIIKEAEVKRDRVKRHLKFFFKVCYWSISLILLLMLLTDRSPLFMIIISMLVAPLDICIIYYFCQRKKGIYGLESQAIERLAHSKDKRVIGVLLDSLVHFGNYNPPVQRRYLLQPLLPLLTPDDASLLTKEQKRILTYSLTNSNEEFMFTVFSALEQIGDSSTIHALKDWRATNRRKYAKPEVKKAYTFCLAAIEARAALSRSDSQLLRPSSPTDGADTYLRPVTQKIDENAETLLRADLTPQPPLPIPSCLGEEGEPDEETVGDDVAKGKS